MEGMDSGVDSFGNVWPGRFSPVRLSDFKESLEEFSVLPGESRIGEFSKRETRPTRYEKGVAVGVSVKLFAK
jgi:hypothetical protein